MPPGEAPSAKTATYIVTNKIAIRVGHEPEGACYGLIDLAGAGNATSKIPTTIAAAETSFKKDPKAKFDPAWKDRLWNSCFMMHTLAKNHGQVHFLRNGRPQGERYHSDSGQADGYTFAKCNDVPHGNQDPKSQPIDIKDLSLQQLYDAVFAELTRLGNL